jgi:hypothetical protein
MIRTWAMNTNSRSIDSSSWQISSTKSILNRGLISMEQSNLYHPKPIHPFQVLYFKSFRRDIIQPFIAYFTPCFQNFILLSTTLNPPTLLWFIDCCWSISNFKPIPGCLKNAVLVLIGSYYYRFSHTSFTKTGLFIFDFSHFTSY